MMKTKLTLFLMLLTVCAVMLRGDTLSTLFSLDVQHDLQKVTGSAITHDKGNLRVSQGFINGTATDSAEANAVINSSATVSSAAAVIIDLNAVSDPLGTVTAFSTVKIFALKNLDTTDSITLGDGVGAWGGSMATGTVITIPPTGIYLLSAPYAGLAVASPAYVVINCADSAEYDLRVIGTK